MQQRLDHIDIAKGLSILIVVFSHNLYAFGPRGDWFNNVFTFQVPLFFFLSGIFFSTKASWWQHVFNKADGLLKPYFTTLLLIGLALFIVRGEAILPYAGGVLYGNGKTIALEPMWFLTHLFLVTLAAWLVLKIPTLISSRWRLLIVILGLYVLGVSQIDRFWQAPLLGIQASAVPGLPFSADILPVTTAYFLLGYWLKHQLQNFRVNLVYLYVCASIFFVVNTLYTNDINFNMRIYEGYLIATVEALTGFYLAMAFAVWIQRIKPIATFLLWAGNGSLFVLIFHNIFQYGVYIAIVESTGIDTLTTALIAFSIGASAPLLIWWFVKGQPLLSLFYFPLKRHPWIAKRKALSQTQLA